MECRKVIDYKNVKESKKVLGWRRVLEVCFKDMIEFRC